MDSGSLDQIRVNFNQENLFAINLLIGLMVLGVSLDLRPDDFRRILSAPKGFLAGVAAQLFLLPAFTYLLTRILAPPPSTALGMILLSSCPGSNISTILSYLARGNAALSMVMTGFCTVAAILTTPFNLSFWGRMNPETAAILQPIGLDPLETFMGLFMIVGVPLTLGLSLSRLFPHLPEMVRRPFKLFSTLAFVAVVCVLLRSNQEPFLTALGPVLLPVLIGNGMAFALGYGSGRILGLTPVDLKAVCLEVGIQNPALALIFIFNFFEGAGGMAIYSACWGVWQLILGLALARFLSTRFPGRGRSPSAKACH
jgi:bile acid:Na+ symporter, BASS family